VIKRFWQVGDDGTLYNPRLREELTKAHAAHENRCVKAAKGAKARWGDAPSNASSIPQAMPQASTEQCLDDATQIQNQIQNQIQESAPSPAATQPLTLTPPSSPASTDPERARDPSGTGTRPPSTGTVALAVVAAPARAAARPQARAAARTPSLFDALLQTFEAGWQRLYRVPYKPTAADRSQLGRLLQTLTPDEAQELPTCFERYFADGSRWVAEDKRHSLTHFCTDGGFNKYRIQVRVARTADQRTAMALDRIQDKLRQDREEMERRKAAERQHAQQGDDYDA
jgi:hypothetical protein